MELKIIKDVLGQNLTLKNKIKKLCEYYSYYRNLKNSLQDESLYSELEGQNEKITKLMNEFSEDDYLLINKLFNNEIKDFLKKQKLEKNLNFTKTRNFFQVGPNFVFVEEPVKALWTTGKGFLYMPTKPDSDNSFEIELFSIPPLNVEIGFENNIIKNLNFSSLVYKKISFVIDKSLVKEKISQIFVNTDKVWFPNSIMKREEIIPVGIGVISITNYSL